MNVFVTGASGLVGLNLVKYLCSQGISTTALVRRTSRTDQLQSIARQYPNLVKLVIGDLLDPGCLTRLMRGHDVVVHTAALIEALADSARLDQVNVGGTRSAIEAAIAAGVTQFIHISSLSVITGEKDRYGTKEDEPLRYCKEAYANSKISAEKLVTSGEYDSLINITVLRPGFIYGPNERAWLTRLIETLRRGRGLLVARGTKETCVIYVENVCRAIDSCLLNPITFGQIYNLTDGQGITKKQLFDTICDGLGIPRVTTSIPISVARLLVEAATISAKVAPLRIRRRLEKFSRPAYRLAAVNQGFDISKAERDLGYLNRIPFHEGMNRTLAHWCDSSEAC
jgi:nucleoside-diphosphate-sugar epimerase